MLPALLTGLFYFMVGAVVGYFVGQMAGYVLCVIFRIPISPGRFAPSLSDIVFLCCVISAMSAWAVGGAVYAVCG
jgi:hypothetical protein